MRLLQVALAPVIRAHCVALRSPTRRLVRLLLPVRRDSGRALRRRCRFWLKAIARSATHGVGCGPVLRCVGSAVMTWPVRAPGRIMVAAAVAATACLLPGHVSPDVAEGAMNCSTSGRTVISTPTARVFTLRRWMRGAWGGRERARVFFGCARRSHRVHPLRWYGERLYRGPTQSVREPRMNGDYFLAQAAGGDAQGWSFGVWNLASGQNTYQGGFDWESDEAVDIEVGVNGGVVWIEPWQGTVTKVDRGKRGAIGRSDDVEPRTDSALAVDGDTVTWQSQTAVESYMLNGAAR